MILYAVIGGVAGFILGALILFRLRAVDALVVVVLAQVVTNPLVEACTIGAATYLPNLLIPIVAVLEVAAFVAGCSSAVKIVVSLVELNHA